MSILIDKTTRVITQGITGSAGSLHTDKCLEYGPQSFVGGVTPKKGGTTWTGKDSGKSLPVFNTVAEAVARTGATATMLFVPPPMAADAIMEAADAGIRLIVAITEGIPVLDMAKAKRFVQSKPNCRLVGLSMARGLSWLDLGTRTEVAYIPYPSPGAGEMLIAPDGELWTFSITWKWRRCWRHRTDQAGLGAGITRS